MKHRNTDTAYARLERRRKVHGSTENGARKAPGSQNPHKPTPRKVGS